MNTEHYCRIRPDQLAQTDVAESLRLAIDLVGRRGLCEITLFTKYPYTILKYFDGLLSGGETKKLIAGQTICYHGIYTSYVRAIDGSKKYDVILAINCLTDQREIGIKNFNYQIILASVSPDHYSLSWDYWIRDINPLRF